MTNKQKEKILKKLTKEMMKRGLESGLEKLDKAFSCGAFDINDFDVDYELPKIVATALLEESAWQTSPLGQNNKKILSNLRKML